MLLWGSSSDLPPKTYVIFQARSPEHHAHNVRITPYDRRNSTATRIFKKDDRITCFDTLEA
jgi:hypothetical protein